MDRYKVSKMEEDLKDIDLEQFKNYKGVLGSYKRLMWLSRLKWTAAFTTGITVVALSWNYFNVKPSHDDIDNYLQSDEPVSSEIGPRDQNLHYDYLDTVRFSYNSSEQEMTKQVPVQVEKLESKVQKDSFKFIKASPGYSLDSALVLAQEKINYNSEKKISGTMTLVVIVDKEGKITEPKIISGLEPKLDSIMLELIVLLPAWQPAKLNNIAEASTVTIPVEISINPLR